MTMMAVVVPIRCGRRQRVVVNKIVVKIEWLWRQWVVGGGQHDDDNVYDKDGGDG
jgi:hypothetical protein